MIYLEDDCQAHFLTKKFAGRKYRLINANISINKGLRRDTSLPPLVDNY